MLVIKFYTDALIDLKISYVSSIDLSSSLYVNTTSCGSLKLHVGALAGTENIFPIDYQIVETGYHEININNAFNYFSHINTWQTQSGIKIQLKVDTGSANIKYAIKCFGI